MDSVLSVIRAALHGRLISFLAADDGIAARLLHAC
jgi:DNA-binding transcriptional regulator LsrR (DeoR family)